MLLLQRACTSGTRCATGSQCSPQDWHQETAKQTDQQTDQLSDPHRLKDRPTDTSTHSLSSVGLSLLLAPPLGMNSLLHSACYLRTACPLSASFLRHFSLTVAGLRAPLSRFLEGALYKYPEWMNEWQTNTQTTLHTSIHTNKHTKRRSQEGPIGFSFAKLD